MDRIEMDPIELISILTAILAAGGNHGNMDDSIEAALRIINKVSAKVRGETK